MTDLPAQWALDKAAKAAGCRDWGGASHVFSASVYGDVTIRNSIIAHARTIELHEQPPVDEDEEALWRIFRHWDGRSLIDMKSGSPTCWADSLAEFKRAKGEGK